MTREELAHRAIQRRAIEAVIWGMPAVNYHLMYQEISHCSRLVHELELEAVRVGEEDRE